MFNKSKSLKIQALFERPAGMYFHFKCFPPVVCAYSTQSISRFVLNVFEVVEAQIVLKMFLFWAESYGRYFWPKARSIFEETLIL